MEPDFTIEQFKEWVDETFPDNRERAIAEYNFRDGLAKLADFVFQTNSTEFVQSSIEQINIIKGQASNFAQDAETSKVGAGNFAQLTAADRELVLLAKTDALAAFESYRLQFMALIAQGFTPKGNWDIVANTPNISSISKANGDAYIVSVAGTTAITGASIAMIKGDAVHWNAADSKWIYRPNAAVPADGTVTPEKLISWISNMFAQLPDDSPYKWVLQDSMNRNGIALRKDGFIEGKFIIEAISMMANAVATATIQNGAVTASKLAAEVLALLIQSFEANDSSYWFLITDAMNRIGFAIEKDGTITAKINIADGSITAAKLAADVLAQMLPASFKRLNDFNANDIENDLEDDWREVNFTIPVKTPSNGFAFSRFAPSPTKGLRGLNNIVPATSLQFRQSNRLNIKGRRYRGTYNPSASGVLGTNYKGVYGNSYTNTYPAFTVGAIGDCYMANVTAGATTTQNGLTFKNGDLIVQTAASTFAVQPGPGDGSFVEGDFWNVTNTSQFGKINLVANQRILFLGLDSQSGPKYVEFTASKTGEFYIMGECTPATFDTITSPLPTGNGVLEGDLYICSTFGNAKTLAVLEGDSIAYETGWFVAPGNMKTYASGAMIFLPCTNSNEWEVRKTDKSNTQVILNLAGSKASLRRRVNDAVRLWSDSMFGAGGIGTKIVSGLVAIGRTATFRSMGGATSSDILSIVKLSIRATTDTYAGQLHVFWHGQNNPSTDIEQVQSCALQMASVTGAKQKRFIFWSVLGIRSLSFNGTRIVCAVQEGAFAGTNYISDIEKWYEIAFSKQWWSPRRAMLEAAVGRTAPDPNFPGMTEAQVAATYGIVPFSFFFDYSTKPFTADQLVYDGDWTSATLPVTAPSNYHYYRRTVAPNGSSVVGNLIVFKDGVWTEYTFDSIHPVSAGGDVLSSKFLTFLTSINI